MFGESTSHQALAVIVVDDHDDVAELIAQGLRADGYAAVAATSALEALQLADAQQPACVLLDVHMPVMDGAELARRLREKFGGDVTLIAMTGVDESSDQHARMQKLVDYYLRKPLDLRLLAKLLPPQS